MSEDARDATPVTPIIGEAKTVQARIVKFNADNQPIEVNLQDVNKLFIDIDKYNDQFSMGSMMARSLFSIFEDRPKDESSIAESVAQEEGSQKVDAFFLTAAHKKLLDNVGLSIEPVAGGATLMLEGQEAREGKIWFNVVNRDRFTSFLGALKPEQISETGLKPNLEKLSGILSAQILNYDHSLKTPKNEILELFGGLDKIITEYKRLGMTNAVEDLETYLAHARAGDLREYVKIETFGLLNEPGKYFGPADWQRDASTEYLESKWNGAIAILKTTKENPKALSLYQKLLRHLLMCNKVATDSLSSIGYLSTNPQRRDEFKGVLAEARDKLEALVRS